MDFLPEDILQYVALHSSAEPPHLAEISRDTHVHVLKPNMLLGHVAGRVLSIISKIKRPRRILEIGTFTGYSSLCLAEGLPPEGKLITIDVNSVLELRTRKNFERSVLGKKIEYYVGNALTILPTLTDSFDLVFIDADKKNYLNYYQMVFDSVPSGGIIIADNVLWKGKIVSQRLEKQSEAIAAFNNFVKNDTRVDVALLAIRDGISLIYKK